MQLVAIMAKQTQRNKYTIIFSPKTNNTLIVYVIYKSLTIKDTMLLLRTNRGVHLQCTPLSRLGYIFEYKPQN